MTQPYYNPNVQYYQNRMNNIANYQNPMQQPLGYAQQPVQQSQPNNMICRMVTSQEEARNAIIDPLGVNIFTNFSNNEIYTKHIQNDGTSKFNVFVYKDIEKNDEVLEVKPNEDLEGLKKQVNDMGKDITNLKEEFKKYDEQNTRVNANAKQSK